jgi:hypothetical protein
MLSDTFLVELVSRVSHLLVPADEADEHVRLASTIGRGNVAQSVRASSAASAAAASAAPQFAPPLLARAAGDSDFATCSTSCGWRRSTDHAAIRRRRRRRGAVPSRVTLGSARRRSGWRWPILAALCDDKHDIVCAWWAQRVRQAMRTPTTEEVVVVEVETRAPTASCLTVSCRLWRVCLVACMRLVLPVCNSATLRAPSASRWSISATRAFATRRACCRSPRRCARCTRWA